MSSPKTILYVGNYLSKPGINPTFNFYLIPRLREYFNVISISDKESKFLRMLEMMWVLFRSRRKVDIVMIDVYSMHGYWFAVIIAKMAHYFRIPYINLLRGGNLPWRLNINAGISKKLFGQATFNVSPSIYLQKIFVKAGFEVEYLPNFIDIEKYPFKERNLIEAKLLWVRSFNIIYNPLLAVEVLKALVDSGRDARLCMVGPDKDNTVKDIVLLAEKLKVRDRLELKGQLSKEDWTKLSENYDIFINTTNFDNHPVSILEAMALGMPIVSTNVGGLPYLIDDGVNGMLVPPNNTDAIAEAVESLIIIPGKARNISINARKKAETFTWIDLKDRWVEIINRSLGDLIKN